MEARRMSGNGDAHRRLQKHLARQAVGFPAGEAGLRILRRLFTPREAEIAACLRDRPEPLAAIHARSGHLAASPGELADILARIAEKGGIEFREGRGERLYCNAPLVLGMYEMQLDRLTPELLRDFNACTSDPAFALEFLRSGLPQMRTIPVAESITPQHRAATFDEIAFLLEKAPGPFVLMACICRRKKALEGKACRMTEREETCLCLGNLARWALACGQGREIGRQEARELLARNQKEGLVLQPTNTEEIEAVCSCCGCCCGMLAVHRKLPRPMDFWTANFHARVDGEACDGCGACRIRCQVGALEIGPGKRARVDLHRCLGCGLCVPACRKGAILLVKNAEEVRPPRTRDELHGRIMADKHGGLGKIKVAGRLLLGALAGLLPGGPKRQRDLPGAAPPHRRGEPPGG
jgi:Na+-translocating ferredoxin:NAD+ oxidoreductase subunit B